ncbi:MAG: glycosyltransferase family 4 protein [Bacteroidota bacterium]
MTMRIALITDAINDNSGLGRIAAALASEYAKVGHEVHTIAQHNNITLQGVRQHSVPGLPLSAALNKLILRHSGTTVLQKLSCDIVHSFGVGRHANVVSAQSCHLAGMRIRAELRHRHRLFEERNWGLFDHVVLQDEKHLLTSSETQRIVAVSHLVRNQLREFYNVPAEKIVVIPNGIHVQRYALAHQDDTQQKMRKTLGLPDNRFVLLFVGNEFDRKGLRVIIESLGRLNDPSLTLLVAGKADPAPYQALARQLNVTAQVKYVGTINPPEQLFFAADAFVFPTLYEPFGMVVIEAMAAGLPVITSRHCGSVEGMEDEKQLLLLSDPESVDELCEKIRRLNNDETLRKTIADRGMEESKRFTWESVAEKMMDVYRTIQK